MNSKWFYLVYLCIWSRVILPLKVTEYQVAQLYAVAKASKEQTGGGDGVEVLQNCPFDDKIYPPKTALLDGYKTGQYTHKIYHMASKLPSFVSTFLPTSLMTFNEIAWNAYPYCRTILTVRLYVLLIISVEWFFRPEIRDQNWITTFQWYSSRKRDFVRVSCSSF